MNTKDKVYRGTGRTDMVVHSFGVIDVTKEQVIDLICCGLEVPGYMQLFLVHDSVEPTNEEDIPIDFKEQSYLSHCWGDGKVLLVDKEEFNECKRDGTKCKPLVLNEETIKVGLDVFAKHCKNHFSDFINENTDANTGLEFLQCVCFPEYVLEHGHTIYG